MDRIERDLRPQNEVVQDCVLRSEILVVGPLAVRSWFLMKRPSVKASLMAAFWLSILAFTSSLEAA